MKISGRSGRIYASSWPALRNARYIAICDLTQIVDALACLADEGRSSPRKSLGSWHEAMIQRCPNGVTPRCASGATLGPQRP